MAKFIAGFVFGIVTLCGFALYGETLAPSPGQYLTTVGDVFIRAGGYGSDGVAHALKVEADGSVHCTDKRALTRP